MLSPCVGVCRLDADRVCAGCGRTLEEIAQWLDADEATRRAIRNAAGRRLRSRQGGPHEGS